jgi:hypothetical protein
MAMNSSVTISKMEKCIFNFCRIAPILSWALFQPAELSELEVVAVVVSAAAAAAAVLGEGDARNLVTNSNRSPKTMHDTQFLVFLLTFCVFSTRLVDTNTYAGEKVVHPPPYHFAKKRVTPVPFHPPQTGCPPHIPLWVWAISTKRNDIGY